MDIILKYFSDFSEQQLEQIKLLEPLYKVWNEKINVISRKDIDGLYEKHVLHSLSIAAAFEFADSTEILDLGTGGGFPGIPLAIFFPQVKFHLVDSIAKKLKVVEEVAAGIGLKNITTQHSRVEEINNRRFDHVVSRAVAPLKDLWKWSKPILRSAKNINRPTENENNSLSQSPLIKPSLICLKGGDLAQEIQESGLRPRMMEIQDIFKEDYFHQKYIIQVTR